VFFYYIPGSKEKRQSHKNDSTSWIRYSG